MDQKGALREIAYRENKTRVDKINIIRSKHNRKAEKERKRKESANKSTVEEPFYERLARLSKAREQEERSKSVERRAKFSHAAAFKPNGECWIKTAQWSDLQKLD